VRITQRARAFRCSDEGRPRAAGATVLRVIDTSLPYASVLASRADALSTVAVHGGDSREAPDGATGALEPPIVMSSAFGFASAEEAAGAFTGANDAYIYGRWGNPTVEALEARLAALEGATAACATASGMAAVSGTVLGLCDHGSHVVAPRSMYGESARLLRERLPRFGITTTFVDATDVGAYEAALRPTTKLLYIETPANPNLAVSDVSAIVALAKSRGIVTVADNTFATPFAQTPLARGVDLVLHSMTKAIGGHGDVIAGCVCGGDELVAKVRDFVIKGAGGVLSPHAAFLVARGIRTFALRQEKACANAASIARSLAEHPRVAKVHHPSLPSHPGHAIANRQMHAYGAILSLELRATAKESALEAGRRVLDGVKLMTHAVSLGDVRTLIVHPASTTHSTMPKEIREAANITDGLLRVSVGIESARALYDDLARAIDAG
jgi:methionine-gamma-lyase